MIERFDVLDERGRKTGVAMPRNLVHKRGLWHYGADVWLYNSKGEILIQKRSMRKRTSPGLWTGSATCHVSAGETPKEAAVRELHEEIGVTAVQKDLKEIIVTKLIEEIGTQYHNREHLHVFLYKRDVDATTLKLQRDEVSDAQFIPFSRFKHEAADPKLAKRYTPLPYFPALIRILGKAISGH